MPPAARLPPPGEQPREKLLVGLAREGDETAFERLLRLHQGRAYAVAFRMTGNHHDAEDAVQDAFVSAWRHLPQFHGDASFGTWLTRIVLNECHSRRRRHRPTTPLDPTDETASQGPAMPSAEQDVVSGAHRDAVQQAILRLPSDQRSALVLHVFAGYSHADVGRILRINEGAAKVRVHRARRALVEQLRDWR